MIYARLADRPLVRIIRFVCQDKFSQEWPMSGPASRELTVEEGHGEKNRGSRIAEGKSRRVGEKSGERRLLIGGNPWGIFETRENYWRKNAK